MVGDIIGLRKHSSTLHLTIEHSMQQIQIQETFCDTQQDMKKLEGHYLNGDLSQQDYLTILIWQSRVTTKPCYSPCQSSKGDNSLKATGILKKVRRLLSLTAIFMLLSLSIFLTTGLSLGLVTMVMVVSLVLFGSLLHLTNNLWYIENSTFLKSLPQTWQI